MTGKAELTGHPDRSFQKERSKERLVRELTRKGNIFKGFPSYVRWKCVFAAGRKLQIDWEEGKKKLIRRPVRDMTLSAHPTISLFVSSHITPRVPSIRYRIVTTV